EPVFQRMDYTADGFAGSAMMPVWNDEMWAQPMTATNAERFDFTTRWRLWTPMLTVKAGKDRLDVIPLPGSTLLDGAMKTRAVHAGAGSAEAFAAADAAGKVAVVPRSGALTGTQRAANAVAAGAEMLIVVNDADGEFSEWSGSEDYESDAPIPVASV